MQIKLYNSLTNQIEEFKSIKENEISMYVCGPTVYNDIHIGNARPVVFFDMVHRFFKYIGYIVKYVSNFIDIDDKIIYVGKAKVLKNRVRQYFQSSKNHSSKVKSMVKNIEKFEYIITDSELEALILECNLIKKYKPKYNVLLRDDKTYPYIKVTTTILKNLNQKRTSTHSVETLLYSAQTGTKPTPTTI